MYNNSEIWNYEMLALDIRTAWYHLGERLPSRGGQAGEITTDDLLENIFSKFCIGK